MLFDNENCNGSNTDHVLRGLRSIRHTPFTLSTRLSRSYRILWGEQIYIFKPGVAAFIMPPLQREAVCAWHLGSLSHVAIIIILSNLSEVTYKV